MCQPQLGMMGGDGNFLEHFLAIRGRLLIGPSLLTGVVEALLCFRLWSQLSGYTAPGWVFTLTRPLVAPFANLGGSPRDPTATAFEFATLLAFEVYLLTFIALVVIVYMLPAFLSVWRLVPPLPGALSRPRNTMTERNPSRSSSSELIVNREGDEPGPLHDSELQVGETPVLRR